MVFDEWLPCTGLGSGWEVLDHRRHPTMLAGRLNKTWQESGLWELWMCLLRFILSQSVSSVMLVKIPAFRK